MTVGHHGHPGVQELLGLQGDPGPAGLKGNA